jgi:hypothetical protein
MLADIAPAQGTSGFKLSLTPNQGTAAVDNVGGPYEGGNPNSRGWSDLQRVLRLNTASYIIIMHQASRLEWARRPKLSPQ